MQLSCVILSLSKDGRGSQAACYATSVAGVRTRLRGERHGRHAGGVPLIGFERTPAAVVKTGLRALEQKRGYAIDGPRNRIVAFSARLLPRGIIARVSAQLMGKGIA